MAPRSQPIRTDFADLVIPFAVGTGNMGKVKNKALKWPKFIEKFQTPTITQETRKQFDAMSVERQTELKNVNGFWLGGHSTDGHRRRSSIEERTILTLDFEGEDFTPDMLDQLLSGVSPIVGTEFFVHTSRKHRPEAPRIRLCVPLSRPVTAEEYEPTVRRFAARLNPTLDSVDPVSFRHSQMMFLPSVCKDGVEDYICDHNRGVLLDPDDLLKDWDRNFESLPFSEKHQKARASAKKAEDPREKEGIVGAFCKAWTVPEAIVEFELPYTEEGDDASGDVRYTFTGGLQRNRKEPICFSPYLCRARNLVERFFNKIKQRRRVATRYDKLAANYLAFVKLASIRPWLRIYEFTA